MDTIDIKPLPDSEIEITGELATEEFEKFRAGALNAFKVEVVIDGFRPGNAPDQIVKEKVGEEKILFEMAERALADFYPRLVTEKKLDVIGRPEITITKLATGNPLGFKIKTAILPTVTLTGYQAIAKAEMAKPAETVTVEETDIDQVIEEMRKEKARAAGTPETLPEANDDFAKSLGQFTSLLELREKIKTNLEQERSYRIKEKKRLTIIDEIIKTSDLPAPRVLIENETERMFRETRGRVEQMGLKFEDYLTHLKKTEEELKKEWEPEAVKQVKFGLVLEEIAKQEKVEPTTEEIEHEAKHFIEHYPDADPERVKNYVRGMITHEKVYQFLENQK